MIELISNQRVTGTLANLSAGGRLPHALLFEGPAGIGKKTAARLFAQYALCTGSPKPCGACPHCVKVEKGIHPDVRYYTVPEGKKEFPIDLVRELRQDAYILPNEGQCKVYVIDRAHTMNAAAQNALLKIIEEPPDRVRFALLCENRSRMLPTILSRVTALELECPGVEECAGALARLAPGRDEAERRAAAAGSGGNIGRALSLIGTAKPSRAAADAGKLRETLLCGDRYQALKLLAAYDKDREGLTQLLTLLREGFARLACARFRPGGGGEDARILGRVPPAQLLQIAQTIEDAQRRANQNVSIPLLCACMVEGVKSAF